MKPTFEISTTMVWKEETNGPKPTQPRKLVVTVSPHGDMDIHYDHPGCDDQLLELDETAWHALYAMMGEVRP